MDYSSTTIQAENNISQQQQLQPFDVLCGRDKQCYNNIGNRRFRILINCNLPRYLECESRNTRSGIIVALTQELCCGSGTCGNSSSASSRIRFFKRKGKKGTCDDANNSLIELGFKQCREKIGHALRDAASQHNNSSIKSQEAIEKNRQKESQKELNEQRTEEANILNNFDNENTTVNGNLDLEIHLPNNSHQFSIQMLHGLREKEFHASPSLPLTNNSNDFLNIDNKYTTLNHNLQPNRRSHRFSRMMFNSISEELLEISSIACSNISEDEDIVKL